ncbi:hypothetical protein DYB25_007819 [Aphanomyces astaci]|nr:hypothetical protein DYB36_006288 [Aphanomyces astaci]RHY27637.1 hypothetical protein DYB25_007819 [Aphanomyces astaci]RHY55952.1 hypothetical protein DYB34_008815 [Aphanomyces astaci]RHY79081.1 hypothetical protein DYB38_011855 [Aphanomyces astaci]RHZ33951.1 hypothetical protein DYB31_012524 [Aphanomyces astaci]
MKANLGLLMSIRETDCDIQRAKEQLQKYHTQLEGRGLGIGSACSVQPNNTSESGAKPIASNPGGGNEASVNAEDDDDDDQNTDSSSDSSGNE